MIEPGPAAVAGQLGQRQHGHREAQPEQCGKHRQEQHAAADAANSVSPGVELRFLAAEPALGLGDLHAFPGPHPQTRGAGGELLLPLGIFRDRNFALSNVAVAAAGAAVPAVLVPLYFYLESVRAMSGADAGLVVAPMAILAMVCVPIIGIFGDLIHPRVIPSAGFALFAVTLMIFAMFMTPDSVIGCS
ncbi:hypothetical protein CcI156_09355 [Frankia sp. CcI156]|uniref:MFS transporter n=1 Tax=Frankia casuarinae (strain DSM 45818 / CECT 9043 / HFP020203 / CcI3) TaxID=106370 RepID=Q2JAF3_FRACC|nr:MULTISPECIES: hypothetical protein [Frankia]ABD11739.1 hypothetical protein Francci3_2372 [Frankia casuarinae]ETA03424.1 hypothetical protein CcI6DRAFT_01140 [Frankia sp. CcI6]EYT93200.1 hypothetical protein ThrDRAFT_01170 [Frankia casuarinae]KFB03577.1 hypothetical protein ALLO2DRAFT_03619 [Frankia sp. Allo2]OAA26811.1 hypothetical protein AAY23_102757 [Frankia casuarinae]